jgi:hypothetical protein
MTKLLKNRLASKRGQSSVEYILLAAVLVGAVFMFGGKFKEGISSLTKSLFDGGTKQVDSLIK